MAVALADSLGQQCALHGGQASGWALGSVCVSDFGAVTLLIIIGMGNVSKSDSNSSA